MNIQKKVHKYFRKKIFLANTNARTIFFCVCIFISLSFLLHITELVRPNPAVLDRLTPNTYIVVKEAGKKCKSIMKSVCMDKAYVYMMWTWRISESIDAVVVVITFIHYIETLRWLFFRLGQAAALACV